MAWTNGNEKFTSIYIKLYDISRRNLRNTGREFVISRDVFASTLSEPSRCITALERKGLSKYDFMQICYLKFLERVPEKEVINECFHDEKPDDEYKTWMFHKIINSEEFLLKKSTMACERQLRMGVDGNATRLPLERMKSWRIYPLIRHIFHMFPTTIRIAIKRRL